MIVLIVATLILLIAAQQVWFIFHGLPAWADWRPKTLRGRFAYLGFCAAGIIVMLGVSRILKGHWG